MKGLGLQIGKYISWALHESAAMKVIAGGRIYPVVVPMDKGAEFPYVTFASDGVEESETKDGLAYDTATVEIIAFGRDLDDAETLAAVVRGAMWEAWSKWNAWDGREYDIQSQEMRGGAEDYDINHDGYYVPLTYTIEVAEKD